MIPIKLQRVKVSLYSIIFCIIFSSCVQCVFAQQKDINALNKQVVQLYGVITTENNIPLPQASVYVEGSRRGTLTNDKGIYSIVVNKGDKVRFSFVGFKDATVHIPTNIQNQYYHLNQQLKEDTTILPTTIVYALPSNAKFEREFLSIKQEMTMNDIAKYNIRPEIIAGLMTTLPKDGREAVRDQINRLNGSPSAYYGGQSQTINVLKPASWSSFVKDWKEGASSNN